MLTDVPVALFAMWTMWYFASLWQEPTWRNTVMFSSCFQHYSFAGHGSNFPKWVPASLALWRVHRPKGLDARELSRVSYWPVLLCISFT